MSLLVVQEAHRRAILGHDEYVAAGIRGGGELSAREALAVYRNNTRQTLIGALQQRFPVCLKLVGEPCFQQLAARYVGEYPSFSPNLTEYGERFPALIDRLAMAGEPLETVPYLGDMARAESLLYRAYYAANRGDFDFRRFEHLSRERPSGLRFRLAPGVAVLAVCWPVAKIWALHQKEKALESVTIERAPGHVLVERKRWRPQLRSIDASLYTLLQAIAAGESLADIVSTIPTADQVLVEAVQRRWIEDIHVDG